MIEIIVQVVMSMILLVGGVIVGVTLIRMHRDSSLPSLFDLLTATDRTGRVRLDARKCFEVGAFVTSTWIMVFITAAGKFNEMAFGLYMATYTAARFLRDREKRLSGGPKDVAT